MLMFDQYKHNCNVIYTYTEHLNFICYITSLDFMNKFLFLFLFSTGDCRSRRFGKKKFYFVLTPMHDLSSKSVIEFMNATMNVNCVKSDSSLVRHLPIDKEKL